MISSQTVIQDNLIKQHTTQVHFSCKAVEDIGKQIPDQINYDEGSQSAEPE